RASRCSTQRNAPGGSLHRGNRNPHARLPPTQLARMDRRRLLGCGRRGDRRCYARALAPTQNETTDPMTEPDSQLLAERGINELRKQTIDPSDRREFQLGVGLTSSSEDTRLLARAWRVVASPGVLAIAVGVVLLIWPDVTDLIGLVGAFAL